MLANVQSIRNKTYEVEDNMIHIQEFRYACLVAFKETWLRTKTATWQSVAFSGDQMGQGCIYHREVSKRMVLYVNQQLYTKITVRDYVYTDTELLSVSVHPFYLPCEFPLIFITVAYINPKANADNTVNTIYKVTQKLQSMSPDTPSLTLCDFNYCNLKSVSSFSQCIRCPTRL